ncbi:MbtH family protein [Kitasatospora mediocidica]|uniref:MbtH family protein n=1 Tax=Kitasatospora mediocidica TaxID=58352 RepID=UPI0005638BBF|nr:MbtH family protein [Kitasatospora mediocidica]
MTNPFEDADSTYVVLVNDQNQHSLWPNHIEVPAGWTTAFGQNNRQACLDYIDQHWTDLAPQRVAVG